MEFQLSYFKSYRMILWKCCTQYASKFEKLSSGHRTGTGQFSFHFPKKGNAKECSNYHTIALISHASEVMLKILQARLQQDASYQMFKLVLEKAEEPEIKLPTSVGSSKKATEFQKNIYFCFIDYAKDSDCMDHNKLENSERDGNTRPPYLPPEKSVRSSRSNS